MKYIIIQTDKNGIKQNFPIIFPADLVHSEVAQAITSGRVEDMLGAQVISAGFLSSHEMTPNCHGRSESIGVDSRGKVDSEIIMFNDTDGGLELG